MNVKNKALECYDSYDRERMTKVMNAIDEGRLIYLRFFEDGSGASFYWKGTHSSCNIPYYYLTSFDAKQTSVILMGRHIDKKCFGI